MADPWFHSDTDDSAVAQVLSEAMDHCVLSQIAAINCSSFSKDSSSLPSHLESRFQRLKTFPFSSGRAGNSKFEGNQGDGKVKDVKFQPGYGSFGSDSSNLPSGQVGNPDFEGKVGGGKVKDVTFQSGCGSDSSNLGDRKVKDVKFQSGCGSFGSDSSNLSSGQVGNPNFEGKLGGRKVKDVKLQSGCGSFGSDDSKSGKFRGNSGDREVKEGKSGTGSVSFRSNSSGSTSGYLGSPKCKGNTGDGKDKERKSRSGSSSKVVDIGCFWCSPKKGSKKKSGGRNVVDQMGLDWGKHDDILSDLRSFSLKEQKKRMKAAMKEEEKINKEAEKIVKWAMQTSARLEFSGVDDELSDDDSGHNFGLH